MANNQIKTRIIHKHDTEANWNLATNFIPKQGEIIVYDKDSTYNYERFKIGDGLTIVSSLPFANDALKAEIQTLLNDKASVSSVTQLSNKLDGIATGAEVNQNAFSNVTVGSTIISADSKTDTLTIVAGSNITLTPDATNDKITIAAKDTTYSNATTSAAGLMSADDKTKFNAALNKLDGIEANANKTVVDTALSPSSTNPVQNKVINSALSGKQATITGAATTIASSDLTSDRALISNSNGKVAASSVSSTELGHLIGVTRSIQEQFTDINNDIDDLDTNKVDKISGKGLSSNDFTSDYITKINDATTKLSGIADGANKTTVDSLLSDTSTNPVQNKVINSALSNKVDKETGKGLSTKDFTQDLFNKLDGISSGAQVNQNAFSSVTDGITTINADSTTDTLTLVAGSNINLALDATNDKVTISATDTTYDAAGSNLGLVKSGGDVTISSGTITVKDDSHNHVISNVDGLQNALDDLENDVTAIKKIVDISVDNPADETINTISEIIGYIEDNEDAISIITNKQNKNLGSGSASKVLVTDASGNITASSDITTTELGYLNNAESNLQEQITAVKNTADEKLAAKDIAITVTGTGNVITEASYNNNGTITLTKGKTLNNYSLPTASSTLGGVKTTSTVTSVSGYTAVPIIDGIPYYKNVSKTDVTNALGYTPPTTNTTYDAGTGLSLSGTTFSVKTGYTTSGKNYKVQPDSNGNLYVNVPWTDSTPVTSVFGRTGAVTLKKSDVTTALGYEPPTTDTNTHYTTRLYAGASGTAANAAATNPYLKVTDDNTYRNQVRFVGSGATTVSSDANGNITISSTDTNTHAVTSVFGRTGAVTLTSSDVTTALGYTPPTTDTNTDTKVTQGHSTSGSYRPLLMHYLYGDYGTDVGEVTNLVYYNETIAAKASTGELKATSFVGSGASLTSLNASNISSGTLSAARLPTSGAAAGTYGPSANVTGSNNATISIPQITVDTYGRITNIATKTYTSVNTDTKVSTTLATTTKAYLLGTSTTPTSTAQGVTSYADTNVYLTTTAGQLALKSLLITSEDSEDHITFSRPGFNYLNAPEDGTIALSFGGGSQNNSSLCVNKTTIKPGLDNTISLGTSSLKWSNIYATTFTGDLEGNAKTATALTSSAGGTNQPVYFSGGKPVVISGLILGSETSNTYRDIQVRRKNSSDDSNGRFYAWVASTGNNAGLEFAHYNTEGTRDADTVLHIGESGFFPGEDGTKNLGGSNYKWKTVYATTFNGTATQATKATQDGSGNTITSTYLKRAGGTMTGELILNPADSASAVYLTSNRLVGDVQYKARFYINGDTGAASVQLRDDTTAVEKNKMTLGLTETTFKQPVNIAGGGTGAATRAKAWENIVAGGGTFTGTPLIRNSTYYGSLWFAASKVTGSNIRNGVIYCWSNTSSTSTTVDRSQFTFRQYIPNSGTTEISSAYESFDLPATLAGGSAGNYNILTTKNTITVEQGGTGSTSKSGARTNLGITSGTSLPDSASVGDIFFLYS